MTTPTPMAPGSQFLVKRGPVRNFAATVAAINHEIAADGSAEICVAVSVLAVPLLRLAERNAKAARRRWIIPDDVLEALAELSAKIGLQPREVEDLRRRVISWTQDPRASSYSREVTGASR